LGFDVPAKVLARVHYTTKRLQPRVDVLEGGGPNDQKEMLKVLTTKYEHWRYESEMRLFTALNDRDPDTSLYFAEFGKDMRLEEVIVGPLSTVTRDELTEALGDLAGTVQVFKARLAFKTYAVTRQRKKGMWK
jgi:hypothetical protein